MGKLPASTGWLWLKQGFALLRKQPGVLTMLLVVNLVFSLLISQLPLIGPLVLAVLIPSFSMAVMMACHQIEQGQRVTPKVLMTGFRQPALNALCKLGLVYLALFVVLTVITQLSLSPELLRGKHNPMDPAGMKLSSSDMTSLLVVSLLQSITLMLLVFSAPLTYWKKMPPGKATFYSVFGVLGAAKPVLTMLLAWFGMFLVVGTVLAMIIGNRGVMQIAMLWVILLFVLVLQCASYASYRQLFGDPAAPPDEKI